MQAGKDANASHADEAAVLRERIQRLEAEVGRLRGALSQAASMRTIANNLSVGVFTIDEVGGGRISYANPAFARILGFDSVEAAQSGFAIATYASPAERAETFRRFLASPEFKARGFVSFEAVRLRQDTGEPVDVRITVTPVLRDGQIVRLDGILEDIRERKRMEEELLKVEKLESLAVLAGGIAHDFNNILTVVLGNLNLVRGAQGLDEASRRRVHSARTAAQRARDLTRQLMTFAKGVAPIKAPASLADVAREAADFCLRGANVRCELEAPESLWPVQVDVGQMSQVFSNLFINANQAMPSGGTIHLRLTNVTLGAGKALPAGEYVQVTLRDEGLGIPREHLSRIFDPFFSTKEDGTGLGLATVYSIVRKHDGNIDVESEVGGGTTFTLLMPAAATLPLPEKGGGKVSRAMGGRALVMDDEAGVREVAVALLESMGFEAQAVPDGAAALQAAREALAAGRRFDVIIADLTVPGGMGGEDLVGPIMALDPEAKVVVSSGYSASPIMSNYMEYGFKGVLPKPYTAAELESVLASVLPAEGTRRGGS